MPPDLAHQFNPSACQADFSYSITPKTIEIQDTGQCGISSAPSTFPG